MYGRKEDFLLEQAHSRERFTVMSGRFSTCSRLKFYPGHLMSLRVLVLPLFDKQFLGIFLHDPSAKDERGFAVASG